MDDAFSVRGVQGVGNLDGNIEDCLDFHRSASNAMLQRHAIQILHNDVRFAVFFIDIVDGADVWMVQGRSRLRLPLKTFQGLTISSKVFGQKFQRYKPVQLGVFRFVNHTHAATTEFFDDAVVREGPADKRFGLSHGRES